MAYQEHDYSPGPEHLERHRIPERASPRSPPPPRAMEPPQPVHTKRKAVTIEMLKKSQLRTAVAMVILVVLLIIIIYFVTLPISNEYPRTMDRDVNIYAFEFNVPDILSEKMPVSLDITSSDDLEFYLLHEDDYYQDITIVDLRNYSINDDNRKTSHFIYEAELDPGRYVVVSYLQIESNQDISITYTLDRYIPMLVVLIICLIFVLLFVICLVRIGLLQRKKSKLRKEQLQSRRPDYGAPERYPPEHPEYYEGGGPYPAPGGSMHPPSVPGGPSPPSQAPRLPLHSQPHPSAPGPSHGPVPHDASQPVTIPCRCGEVIVISESLRPLRFSCPRCGRRGILEGKKEVPEEEGIFY